MKEKIKIFYDVCTTLKNKLGEDRFEELMVGLVESNHTLEQILLYTNSEISDDKMALIRDCIDDGMTEELIKLADYHYDYDDMATILRTHDNNVNKNIIEILLNDGLESLKEELSRYHKKGHDVLSDFFDDFLPIIDSDILKYINKENSCRRNVAIIMILGTTYVEEIINSIINKDIDDETASALLLDKYKETYKHKFIDIVDESKVTKNKVDTSFNYSPPLRIWESDYKGSGKTIPLYSSFLFYDYHKRYNRCCLEVFNNIEKHFHDKDPKDIERFISLYLEQDVKLIAIDCGSSKDGDYWIFHLEK